eukprot:3939919-Rhodomonas_salina.3
MPVSHWQCATSHHAPKRGRIVTGEAKGGVGRGKGGSDRDVHDVAVDALDDPHPVTVRVVDGMDEKVEGSDREHGPRVAAPVQHHRQDHADRQTPEHTPEPEQTQPPPSVLLCENFAASTTLQSTRIMTAGGTHPYHHAPGKSKQPNTRFQCSPFQSNTLHTRLDSEHRP